MAHERRNVHQRRRGKRFGRLVRQKDLAAAPQNHQRFLVSSGRVPADGPCRLEPHESAAHAGRLRKTVQEGAVAPGTLEVHAQSCASGRLRKERRRKEHAKREHRIRSCLVQPHQSSLMLHVEEAASQPGCASAAHMSDRCDFSAPADTARERHQITMFTSPAVPKPLNLTK